uniref:Uncharacterized protein n=1 Tax=Ceratitis capitata TaxID=7213 RepID=W8BB39_CERCA
MSYFRWLCAMHYAKLARHGNALAETVNAFRLHRQQKTLACEAAAKARAEFWSRLTENVRKLRNGEVNTLRSPLQARRLNHEQQTEVIEQEAGAANVASAENFRATAKRVIARIFRGAGEKATVPLQTTALSPLPGSTYRQRAESSVGRLWQQQKQTNETMQQQQKEYQRNAQSGVEKCATTSQKSLAMFTLPRSRAWSEGKSPSGVQQFALQTNQKATATTNKPPQEPAVLVFTAACVQPQCKAAALCADSTTPVTRRYAHKSTEKQKAMLLPERPNILVLPELKRAEVLPKQHASYFKETFEEICVNSLKAKDNRLQVLQLLQTTPVDTRRTHSNCKISMAPEECVLPPETDSQMTLTITNGLDKYKVISLPSGQAIPSNSKRHVQIKVKRDQNLNQVYSASQVKGRKF